MFFSVQEHLILENKLRLVPKDLMLKKTGITNEPDGAISFEFSSNEFAISVSVFIGNIGSLDEDTVRLSFGDQEVRVKFNEEPIEKKQESLDLLKSTLSLRIPTNIVAASYKFIECVLKAELFGVSFPLELRLFFPRYVFGNIEEEEENKLIEVKIPIFIQKHIPDLNTIYSFITKKLVLDTGSENVSQFFKLETHDLAMTFIVPFTLKSTENGRKIYYNFEKTRLISKTVKVMSFEKSVNKLSSFEVAKSLPEDCLLKQLWKTPILITRDRIDFLIKKVLTKKQTVLELRKQFFEFVFSSETVPPVGNNYLVELGMAFEKLLKFPYEILLRDYYLVYEDLVKRGRVERSEDIKTGEGNETWENILYLGELKEGDIVFAFGVKENDEQKSQILEKINAIARFLENFKGLLEQLESSLLGE